MLRVECPSSLITVIFTIGGMCEFLSRSIARFQSGQTSIMEFGKRMFRLPPCLPSFWRNVLKKSLKPCFVVFSVSFIRVSTGLYITII